MANSCLLVIDAQRDFLAKDGLMAKTGRVINKEVVTNIGIALDVARKKKMEIVFTKLVYDLKKLPRIHRERMILKKAQGLCRPKSRGIELFYKPRRNERVIEKNYYSAFYNTKLDFLLRKKGIKNLVIVGAVADICVLLTCADAYNRGYKLIVLEGCIGDYKPLDASLRYYKEQFAAQIIRMQSFQ